MREPSCQKCEQPATVSVTIDFEPGGTQTLRLCDAHNWELYMAVVQWFSGDGEKGGGAIPEYRKTGIMD